MAKYLVKDNYLEAKKSNMLAYFPSNIYPQVLSSILFPNLPSNERRQVYSGPEVLIIYNTMRNLI